jgi:hypothetical protein
MLVAAKLDAAGGTPATGMDLGLDDPGIAAKLTGAVAGLFGAVGQPATRHRHAEAGEDFLGLVFVDVHQILRPNRMNFLRKFMGVA